MPAEAPDVPYAAGYEDDPETGLPMNPSKVRLPSSVKLIADTGPNFGIDVARLKPEHASVVAAAWKNYQAILGGGRPECDPAPFAPSDGGTQTYFCDGYNITRVHSLAGSAEAPGYEYGPSLDFLNGQRIERLKLYTDAELAKLTGPAP
ncbi:hypothetical protein ACFFGH_34000 [Lysobacter korlensis]|uniref:Uncharacterized protein n=1 Tax=Lysobacter korlensis TaxID=553636 RepID=A0ABV6S416_9GAMM